MREIRQSGSEGGGLKPMSPPYPYLTSSHGLTEATEAPGVSAKPSNPGHPPDFSVRLRIGTCSFGPSVRDALGHCPSNSPSQHGDTSERVPTTRPTVGIQIGGCGVGIEWPAFQAFGLVEFGLKPRPKGPGWKKGWPAWAGRRLHPPGVKSSSPDLLDPVRPGV